MKHRAGAETHHAYFARHQRAWEKHLACSVRPSITGHVRTAADVLVWPNRCGALAIECGFDALEVRRIEIVASEMAANTLRHGGGGVVHARYVEEPAPCLEITAEDDGPGFDDIRHALTDGVSRGRTLDAERLQPGESLGIGLGAIERLADELFIVNGPDGGAKVLARKYLT